MIKAIIFDMGGVLIDLDINRCWNNFKTKAGFDRVEEFISTCHHQSFVGAFEAGEIDEGQFYEECRKYCRPGVTDALIADCFSSLLLDISDEKAAYLKELSTRYDLYMLSNNNPINMRASDVIFKKHGISFDEIFKDLFVSCDMKMNKPCPEIFREAIRRIGRDRNELLFIDDSPRNVEEGKKHGIRTVLYVQGEDLRATLEPVLED